LIWVSNQYLQCNTHDIGAGPTVAHQRTSI